MDAAARVGITGALGRVASRDLGHLLVDLAPRALWLVALGGSALYVVAYLALAALRVPYAFELHVTEGSLLDQVRRLVDGQPLYAAPTLVYVPNIYPPFYFYLSALFSLVLGVSFTPLRVVSFLSSLGCAAAIFATVRGETRRLSAAWLAVALFFAMFRVSGAWYDNARVDTLALFLSLALVYLARFQAGLRGTVLAGLVAALALETKQTTILLVAAVGLYLLLVGRWRRLLAFALPLAAVVGAAYAWFGLTSGGWYQYYVFFLPSRHTLASDAAARFWSSDVMPQMGIAALVASLVPVFLAAESRRRELLFYSLVGAALVVSAWSGRAVHGGYLNALFPLCGALAIFFGIALDRVLAFVRSVRPGRRVLLECYVLLVVIGQFALLYYDPRPQFPRAKDTAAGQYLVQTIRSIPGEVLIPEHGYLAAMAGKQSTAHGGALAELYGEYGGAETPEGTRLRQELLQALAEKRYGAVILDESDDGPPWFQPQLEQTYYRAGNLFDDPWVFWPVTARRSRPQFLYLPRT